MLIFISDTFEMVWKIEHASEAFLARSANSSFSLALYTVISKIVFSNKNLISSKFCFSFSSLIKINPLYFHYLPKEYNCEDVITYQWNQSREDNLQGQFNFYYNVTKDSISKGSMFLYMVLLMAIGIIGNILADYVMLLIDLLT
mgnify:CR=1 FL=1